MSVAITLPKMPTSRAGNRRDCQPLAEAKALAVAWLPILALEAINMSGMGILKIFPREKISSKCPAYKTEPKPSKPPTPLADSVDARVPLLLPIEPKKSNSSSFPIRSPLDTSGLKTEGAAVAKATESNVDTASGEKRGKEPMCSEIATRPRPTAREVQ